MDGDNKDVDEVPGDSDPCHGEGSAYLPDVVELRSFRPIWFVFPISHVVVSIEESADTENDEDGADGGNKLEAGGKFSRHCQG